MSIVDGQTDKVIPVYPPFNFVEARGIMKFESEFYHFHLRKCIWNCRLPKLRPICHSHLPPTAPPPDLQRLQQVLQAQEVMVLRHVTSVGKLKCFSLQLVLVQQRNFLLQITIARWIHNFILLHSYATFDSNAIPIPSLTPYNRVFTANLGTQNGAGNVILQQANCVYLIGWELNHNFYECLQRIFIPCATRLYYFPLQRSCPRKPVNGSLI